MNAQGTKGTPALLVALACLIMTVVPVLGMAATTTLVPRGAVWKYLDNGSDQGTAWVGASFDDDSWSSGPAELGYGETDQATVVGFGPSSSSKYITTYFRHTFTVSDLSQIESLVVGVKRDDGAVLYLNGTEVFRTNMPGGTIIYTTRASAAAAEGNIFYEAILNPAFLNEGSNVLAVSVHQSSLTSSDLSFDLDLVAASGASLTRGPYLQQGTPTDVTVRWRTDATTASRVCYGTAPDSLTSCVESLFPTSEHVVALSGLSPDTKYYYSVGTPDEVLAGGDGDTFFVTSPLPATHKQTRIWVLGDSGTANANARAVRDGYESFTDTRHTDLWLMLGDNAYNTGTDAEYQAAVFDIYPAMLKKSVLWSTIGNHDAATAFSSTQTGPYYEIFTLPKNGEAGGLPSGTEAYYSFDYSNIHFVCLDSHHTDRSPSGAMLTWLENDLAQTTHDWIIAFFHHPPYTKGSHDSDNVADSGGRMRDMRENALPILEAAGVDLVLTGHSHSYERSFLLDGHYGLSSTLETTMVLDAGDGRLTGDGAYKKVALSGGSHDGAVHAVAGSSGKISGGALNHPAMFISLNLLGSMVLDVDRNQLDARFLGTTGNELDSFTVVKDTGTSPAVISVLRLDPTPTTATTVRYEVRFDQSVSGVDAADFVSAVVEGPVEVTGIDVTGAGSTYQVALTVGEGTGKVRLDVIDDDTIMNGIGTRLGGTGAGNGAYTQGESYTVGTAVPVTLSLARFD